MNCFLGGGWMDGWMDEYGRACAEEMVRSSRCQRLVW